MIGYIESTNLTNDLLLMLNVPDDSYIEQKNLQKSFKYQLLIEIFYHISCICIIKSNWKCILQGITARVIALSKDSKKIMLYQDFTSIYNNACNKILMRHNCIVWHHKSMNIHFFFSIKTAWNSLHIVDKISFDVYDKSILKTNNGFCSDIRKLLSYFGICKHLLEIKAKWSVVRFNKSCWTKSIRVQSFSTFTSSAVA